jgi:uncharacterized membrane protein
MLQSALELASKITNPVTLVAFVVAFLGVALFAVVKMKNKPIAYVLAAGLILIALTPIVAHAWLSSRGIYQVSVLVEDANHQLVQDAQISGPRGEKKQTASGWEVDIPPQEKSEDGNVTIYATSKDGFQAGSSTIKLDKDYFPNVEITLADLPAVMIHGQVLDQHSKGVAGADVMLPDCSVSTKSDEHGLFEIKSCLAKGKMLAVRAEKGKLSGSLMVPAGDTVQLVLRP